MIVGSPSADRMVYLSDGARDSARYVVRTFATGATSKTLHASERRLCFTAVISTAAHTSQTHLVTEFFFGSLFAPRRVSPQFYPGISRRDFPEHSGRRSVNKKEWFSFRPPFLDATPAE